MLAVTVRRTKVGWIGLLLAMSVGLTTVLAEPAAAAGADEERLFRRHNYARVIRDGRKLHFSASLARKAESHAAQMANKGRIYHSSCLSCRFEGYNWSVGGENVGVGSSMRSLHRAFMDSAPHRKNVLYHAHRYVGIGVVEKGGRKWVAVLFMG
jgi:uncharacterized protein YkwD